MNLLPPQDWTWPKAWDIPARPNPDQWADTPNAGPLDAVLAGFVGRSDSYDPFRSLKYQTEELFGTLSSSIVNLTALEAMGGEGLVWEEGASQPILPERREGLSARQEQELALLLVMREGFDAWGWSLQTNRRRSLKDGAFFLMLAHGFTAAARAMLALPEAPSMRFLADQLVCLRMPGNASDQQKSLLGAFVRADRKEAVDLLLDSGWQEQGDEMPWRDVLDGAQSVPMVQRLLAVPGLPLEDLVGFVAWKAGVGGHLGSQNLRLSSVVGPVVRSGRLDAEGLAAVLLQGMATGGFASCLGMESVDGFSLESLWSHSGVMSHLIVSKPGQEQPLGRWMTLVALAGIKTHATGYLLTNPQLCGQASKAGLAWLKNHDPEEAMWMEAGAEALSTPQGKTHEEMALGARLVYESVQAMAAVRHRCLGLGLDEAKQQLWNSFPYSSPLPPAVCESQRWLARTGSMSLPYFRDLVADEETTSDTLNHLFECSLQAIRGDADALSEEALDKLSKWEKAEGFQIMVFWWNLLERPDFSLRPPVSPQTEEWLECIQHLPESCFELDPDFRERLANKVRGFALDQTLPAPVSSQSRPRF